MVEISLLGSERARTGNRPGYSTGFKSPGQAQRFLWVHGVVQNLFRLGRHVLRAAHYRLLRDRSFREWSSAAVK